MFCCAKHSHPTAVGGMVGRPCHNKYRVSERRGHVQSDALDPLACPVGAGAVAHGDADVVFGQKANDASLLGLGVRDSLAMLQRVLLSAPACRGGALLYALSRRVSWAASFWWFLASSTMMNEAGGRCKGGSGRGEIGETRRGGEEEQEEESLRYRETRHWMLEGPKEYAADSGKTP